MTFVTFALLAVVAALWTKERMIAALLLKASDEVPEGSGVIHVIERSHDGC
jgi:hypothetical protein